MAGWRPGWAKGLTAATHPGLARMAAAKRGRSNGLRGRTALDHPGIARNAQARRGKKRGPYNWHSRRTGRLVFGPQDLVGQLCAPYSYLLGLYLGDGCVYKVPSTKQPRTARFDVYLDARYPAVVEDCLSAMRAIHPRRRASSHTDAGCTTATSFGLFWLELFPQHGTGRKHTRKIDLADWQRKLVDRHRWEFFRGMMDSDGSRFDRVVGGRRYPAYEFTNHSTDIIQIFCRTADELGIHYTIPDWNSVSIATRPAVALLDSVFPRKERPPGGTPLLLGS